MRRVAIRLVLMLASTAVCAVLAEFAYRAIAPGPLRPFYLDSQRRVISLDGTGESDEQIVEVNPVVIPGRVRNVWAPGAHFYICYENPTQEGFDDYGCVENRINSRRVRDREELCQPKPPGQRRVVCVGDSFTFGWGVRVEDTWVRRVESVLRKDDDSIRTVNCGASGALFADEYALSLRERFHEFEPDVVVATFCLNDLIPSFRVLSHREPLPRWLRESRMLRDLFAGYALECQLHIDPTRDVVEELLAIPATHYGLIGWLGPGGVGHQHLWAGGGPQRAIEEMRIWCESRGIRFGVTIWPYLQGLGPGEHYPFATIHRMFAEHCRESGVPCLDVLPELRGHPTADLWVHSTDFHANRTAQELVTPAIARFVRSLLDA